MKKTDLPVNKECHCGSNAKRYRVRIFINQLDKEVSRCFYRCENCFSRINQDFINWDKSETIDILELRNKFKNSL